MLYLSEVGRVKVKLKLKGDLENMPDEHSMEETDESFESLVEKMVEEDSNLSKIWICGPPMMNMAVTKVLR